MQLCARALWILRPCELPNCIVICEPAAPHRFRHNSCSGSSTIQPDHVPKNDLSLRIQTSQVYTDYACRLHVCGMACCVFSSGSASIGICINGLGVLYITTCNIFTQYGFVLYLLMQNDQIRHGSTYGEGRGVFLGQPRHCVCTNASRGLSAIAEFLVMTEWTTFSTAQHNTSNAAAEMRSVMLARVKTRLFHTHSVSRSHHNPGLTVYCAL